MVDALITLTSITVVLVAALVATVLSKKLKLPSPLLLFIAGLVLFYINYAGQPVVQFSGNALSMFSIAALILVIFEATSRIVFSKLDTIFKDAVVFFITALVASTFVLSYAAHAVGLEWFAAIMFAVLISCVEFSVIFPRHHVPKNKVTQFLHDESNLSTAFVLIIPFIVISFLNLFNKIGATPSQQVLSFSVSLFGGVGAGLLIGLLLFKTLHMRLFEKYSLVMLIATAVLTYLFAEKIDGNGIIAVATLGIIFGNVFLKQKEALKHQLHKGYSALEAILFVIVGAIVGIPLTKEFLIISFSFFALYVVVRFIASQFLYRQFSFFERTEIALFAPKGLATITVAFALLNYSFAGSGALVQYLLGVFVFSLVFDTILAKLDIYKHR